MAKYQGTEWEFILAIDAIAYQRDAYLTKAMLENVFGARFSHDFSATFRRFGGLSNGFCRTLGSHFGLEILDRPWDGPFGALVR